MEVNNKDQLFDFGPTDLTVEVEPEKCLNDIGIKIEIDTDECLDTNIYNEMTCNEENANIPAVTAGKIEIDTDEGLDTNIYNEKTCNEENANIPAVTAGKIDTEECLDTNIYNEKTCNEENANIPAVTVGIEVNSNSQKTELSKVPRSRKQDSHNIKRHIKAKATTNGSVARARKQPTRLRRPKRTGVKVKPGKGDEIRTRKSKSTLREKRKRKGGTVKTLKSSGNKKDQNYKNSQDNELELGDDLEGHENDSEHDGDNDDDDDYEVTDESLEREDEAFELGKQVKKCRRKYFCSLCNKELCSLSSLRRHEKKVSCNTINPKKDLELDENGKLQTVCKVCERKLSSPANLRRHISTVHSLVKPSPVYRFPCTFEGCIRRFDLPSNLKKHYDAVHLNIRKYLCHICSHMFKTISALKTHMQTIHTKIVDRKNIYKCEVCKKMFSTRFKLSAHETVHTDLKPYKCEVDGCGKVFRLKDSLRKHMRAHENYKPHVCGVCKQAFSRKMYLDTHQYKHTGVKLFKCPVCEKSFSQKGNLHVHLRGHGENHVPFHCKICDKSYMTKESLSQHLRSCHGVHDPDSEYANDVVVQSDSS